MLEGKLEIEPEALAEIMNNARKPKRRGALLSLPDLLKSGIDEIERDLALNDADYERIAQKNGELLADVKFAAEAAGDAEKDRAQAFFTAQVARLEAAIEKMARKNEALKADGLAVIARYRTAREAVLADPAATALGEVILAALSNIIHDDLLHATLPPLGGVEDTDGEATGPDVGADVPPTSLMAQIRTPPVAQPEPIDIHEPLPGAPV